MNIYLSDEGLKNLRESWCGMYGYDMRLKLVSKASANHAVREVMDYLEKYVFYVDSRGYQALKPYATVNWQTLKKLVEEL